MPDKMTPASISKQATGSLLPNAHNNALASDIGTKSGPSQIKRFAMTAAPAAIISYGLFLMMGGLIAAEFVPAEASEIREISRIIPEEIEPAEIIIRDEIIRPDVLEAPPPPPKVSIKKVPVDLDIIDLGGAPPAKGKFIKVVLPDAPPVAISNRDATPIRPPIISYPRRAIDQGVEGSCSVHLDVDARGRPYNVKADCTTSMFTREAERAVGQVEFSPLIDRGVAKERRNVVYPLEFTLSDQ